MTQADRIAAALRPIAPHGKLAGEDVPIIDQLGELWERRLAVTVPRAPEPTLGAPPWVAEGRKHLGQREIPGPQNNSWIAQGWAKLGASWFNDDETPWCGFFAAHCMNAVGLDFPRRGEFARAKAWLSWGNPSRPVVGAVVVFGRDGGGHVGFLMGESASSFYVLGGNQGNMVSIAPIAKGRALGFRWPKDHPASNIPLPAMSGGVVSRNEA